MINPGQFNYFPTYVVVRFCLENSERGKQIATDTKSNVFEVSFLTYLKDTGIHVEVATKLPLQEGYYCTLTWGSPRRSQVYYSFHPSKRVLCNSYGCGSFRATLLSRQYNIWVEKLTNMVASKLFEFMEGPVLSKITTTSKGTNLKNSFSSV